MKRCRISSGIESKMPMDLRKLRAWLVDSMSAANPSLPMALARSKASCFRIVHAGNPHENVLVEDAVEFLQGFVGFRSDEEVAIPEHAHASDPIQISRLDSAGKLIMIRAIKKTSPTMNDFSMAFASHDSTIKISSGLTPTVPLLQFHSPGSICLLALHKNPAK